MHRHLAQSPAPHKKKETLFSIQAPALKHSNIACFGLIGVAVG